MRKDSVVFLRQKLTNLLVLVYEDIELLAAAQKNPISLSGLLKKLYFCRGGSAWSVIHLAYCQHKQKHFPHVYDGSRGLCMCAACVLILFCIFLSTDFGEAQASIQHKLHLQECDSGGLGPRALHS